MPTVYVEGLTESLKESNLTIAELEDLHGRLYRLHKASTSHDPGTATWMMAISNAIIARFKGE